MGRFDCLMKIKRFIALVIKILVISSRKSESLYQGN